MDATANDEWIARRNRLFCDVINNLITTFYEIQYKFFFVKKELYNINESISHVDTIQTIQSTLFNIIITFVIDCKALVNLKQIVGKTFNQDNYNFVENYYYQFENEKFLDLFNKLEGCMLGCEKINMYLTIQINRLKKRRNY
ncbi:conserved Plasmodium protein, unknown function [Plasmodium chabaudi chabaudi]|uniref:Uncharacterized protein n=2 Tax=Plasmodium chabaudi TaxID=5825 RepID=A0A077TMY3_PLACU|nr:conserved Plasmodium protein, unknown function [Plasmodium chabaudi chabaudi]SCM23414.1 conserved Plasmodium protein, unknown function [Plasmodium chabaudi adami]SCM25470.1 conserved Plasmodium protein, unknown function [Plasmodium chabaudi chabaudi]SCN62475.1 conserved Plasmodium protein, unknown function [Plasmodium chabaudi adami]SCN62483.1 conserved Plasmodium protein, unknown function [Plasmodium chabaudi chabaudi]VTZ69889.1 conserved Plasmodium protein, unknown function [Plasmodium ch|eukprot:XP_742110.2 conserved Plasmodium protein, unknown function [Plasmodium chabaudi chabaudi]